jgi:hypothetical protein
MAADDATMGTLIGRYSLVKQYHGDLDATSKGEMLGAGDPSSGNAGYVAIEQVTGTLHGHTGSFALQHLGVMENGGYKLSVVVVPSPPGSIPTPSTTRCQRPNKSARLNPLALCF